MFYLLLARPLMDISCLYVSCHETMATIIVQFSQPIQVSVIGNLAKYFSNNNFEMFAIIIPLPALISHMNTIC